MLSAYSATARSAAKMPLRAMLCRLMRFHWMGSVSYTHLLRVVQAAHAGGTVRGAGNDGHQCVIGTVGVAQHILFTVGHPGTQEALRVIAQGLEPVSYTHLDVYKRQGKVGPGSRVLIVGFGGGLTWGGAMIEFA